MKKVRFNQNWFFTFENTLDAFNTFGFDKYSDAAGAAARFYDYSNWQAVELPHDWTLSLQKTPLANTFAGAYPNTSYHHFMSERRSNLDTVYSIGWYRKQFVTKPEWKGKRIFIEFEGVFRDAIVWVNGVYLDRHTSGYTSFAIEITDHLIHGAENSVAVRVDSEQAEGWWYEGAGIYRNVNLLIGEPMYFQYNKTVVKTDIDGHVDVSAILLNDSAEPAKQNVVWSIKDSEGVEVARTEKTVFVDSFCEEKIFTEMNVDSPRLWSIEDPYLYMLEVEAGLEQTSVRFGIRTVAFDPDRGFLLNGIPQKVRGACVHQDFGGVGVALTDNLQYYKIKRLKEMGVNAYRCAHHAPSPVLLDACDELGMLVMDETRAFGTSPEAIRQLTALIERDRNHPSVFIWSLGNEENVVQDNEWGLRLMEKVTRVAKTLDPTRPVTYGANNGPDFVGINGASEVRGVNYIRIGKRGDWLDVYHCEHPDQPIIGTEESSYVLSRGGAVNDLESGRLDSTGNVTMPWGSTPKGWVKYVEEREYFAGSFMWTGFDYRGEPNPFQYANCSSSFGTIDLCGMEKPPFYYYKAWWTDEPVLKLAPHWNHKEGETVTIAVFTNCEEITLSLNGRVLETKKVDRFDVPLFCVAFEPGELSVSGMRGGMILRDSLVTSGDTAELRCVSVLEAKDGTEIGIYEISAYDSNGVFCPTEENEVAITVENGSIVGVGNGDPSNMDYEQKPLAESTKLICSFTDDGASVSIPQKVANRLPDRREKLVMEPPQSFFEDDFRLVTKNAFSKKDKTKTLIATVHDAYGYEYVEFERLGGDARVYLNDELIGDNIRWHGGRPKMAVRPYRFYGSFKEGENRIRVEFSYGDGDLPLLSGYVKIGKQTIDPWRVKLHYGKARVFVKSKTPKQIRLRVSGK